MAEQNNNYTLDTIQKLDFFDAVRKYPGMYIGSKDADGLHHLLQEILSNSIDEYMNGKCSEIKVKLHKDGSVSVEDNGRGIPYGKKDGDITALELVFTEPHAGGKFLNATGTSGYNSAGGEHGLGTKCVNALSKRLLVKSTRDGHVETIEFINGVPKTHTYEKSTGHSGLYVEFLPDGQYLEETKFNESRIKAMLEESSFLCKGLTFIFNDKTTYLSKDGLFDYLNHLNKDSDYLIDPIYFSRQDGTFQLECAIGFNATYGSMEKIYTNNIPQEKGTHLTGFRTAWTSTLNAYARSKGWLKEKDDNLTGNDLSEGQIVILNFKMIDPVFKGQNKEELSSSEGRTYCQRLTADALNEYCPHHEKDIKAIIDKALAARKAREAAQEARDRARSTSTTTGKPKFINLPTKLVDAWSKKRSDCELYITEGDSAASGLIAKRVGETQAIFPIRGKILSCRKATVEQIYKNQEITNLIKALGLDNDPKTGKLKYDARKLRYGKIIFAADADADGLHIRLLLLTCLWWLCPELVTKGHVYVALPPLFRITTKKNEYIFLKDAAELEEYKEQHKNENFLVNRNKGLGEQSPDELAVCLLKPTTRNIQQLVVDDFQAADDLLEVMMGKKADGRRDYLIENNWGIELDDD